MGRDFLISPIGLLDIASNGDFLIAITVHKGGDRFDAYERLKRFASPDKITDMTKRQLNLYFNGELKIFDLPIKLYGKGFCLNVWENIRKIPYGKTITYGELAAISGSPNAYRSAGSCTGKNPIPIVIPCHRVVAKNGLGGFGCGIENKIILLDLEKKYLTNSAL